MLTRDVCLRPYTHILIVGKIEHQRLQAQLCFVGFNSCCATDQKLPLDGHANALAVSLVSLCRM